MAKGDGKLTNLSHKKFCLEYIFDWNATKAYLVAYPDCKSEESAAASSSRLLRNVKVQNHINELQEDIAKTARISVLMNIEELKKIAFSDATRIRSGWMKLKAFKKLTDDERACVQEIVTTKTTFGKEGKKKMVKVKCYSKMDALKTLNEMLGFNSPAKVDVTSRGKQVKGFNIVIDDKAS